MFYRIKKVEKNNGDVTYYPQYRNWYRLKWFNISNIHLGYLIPTHGVPDYDQAEECIEKFKLKQIKKTTIM